MGWVGVEVVVVYFIGMNVFARFSLWEPYALCASGTVNAQSFVRKFLCPISYIFIHSFIINKHKKAPKCAARCVVEAPKRDHVLTVVSYNRSTG